MLGGLFGKAPSLQQHAATIEKILKGIGLDPEHHRVKQDEPNRWRWILQRGSAKIFVSIIGDKDGEGWFNVTCPLVFLPDENLLPFYRRLLDLNNEVPGCALATGEDTVVLCTDRPLKGMDAQEAEEIIHRVSAIADSLDDQLSSEFGAALWQPSQ